MRVALVCSAHGFGHLARQLEVARALRARGAEPVLFTAAPRAVVEEDLPGTAVVPWSVDAGIVQRDSLTEDVQATAALVEARCADAAVDRLAGALAGFDHVVADVAPAALEAARRAGVPATAVGNFDWPWIYEHYAVLRPWAARLRAWQAPHPAIALEPGPGLHGFARVEPAGLLARRRAPVRVVGPEERGVLVCFGGFGLDRVDALLPRVPGVVWLLAPPMPRLDRPDARHVTGVPFPALVAGADAVFTKPGYGILGECMAAGTPIAWLDRGSFPEAPYLERAMAARGDVKVRGGDVAGAVGEILRRGRPGPVPADGAERVAACVAAV